MKLKNHKIFLLVFFVFFIVKLFSLFVAHDIWWDSSVYIGMGKYIYSFSEVGLWESSRPLVWPLILGFFWKIGIDVIFFGKLSMMLFSLGVLFLTYLIALDIFNKKVAIISSLFLVLSSTFFLFGNILHTEIPSTFFALLGFYLFMKKKYNFSGLFLGIAFMTRFFQVFIFIALSLILFYLFMKKKVPYKVLFYFSLFFLIPVVPYLILNYFLYNDIFYPFVLQAFMSKNTGWIFFQPFWFYFVNLVRENILVLFSVIGLLFVFKKPDFRKTSITVAFLFIFVPYTLVAHKEMRLLVPALPFLYILTSYGMLYFINLFKKNGTLILSLLLFSFLILSTPNIKFNTYEDSLDQFYDYIGTEKIDDELWISNPAFITFSNERADKLIYFPLYNSEKVDELILNIDDAKHILINTCDLLPCPPSDTACNQKHDDFIDLLKENFKLRLYDGHGSCEYYIFTSEN
tara:strand:- start:1914 stop:3293 length:1380 start_codon:yes stop_codon:yes gene_type:complete